MSGETKGLDPKGGARRKLIKGSFAVPAVLTLHNGGAIAATSANACLANQNRYPTTQPVASADDVWFRYQLWGFVNLMSGEIAQNAGLWIQGADLSVYALKGGRPWLPSSAFQRFDLRSNSLVTPVANWRPEGPHHTTWKRVNYWVSLRVDQRGNLTGAGRTGAGSAVADSCWNSFAGGVRP